MEEPAQAGLVPSRYQQLQQVVTTLVTTIFAVIAALEAFKVALAAMRSHSALPRAEKREGSASGGKPRYF